MYLNGGDDLQVTLGRVEEAGGKMVMPKTDIGEHGFMAQFFDSLRHGDFCFQKVNIRQPIGSKRELAFGTAEDECDSLVDIVLGDAVHHLVLLVPIVEFFQSERSFHARKLGSFCYV